MNSCGSNTNPASLLAAMAGAATFPAQQPSDIGVFSQSSYNGLINNAVTNLQNITGPQPAQIDLDDIRAAAEERWLKPAELEALLLLQTTSPLPISPTKPSSPPPSGAILLYNRSSTGDYKDDGYLWTKRNNSKKVREDHVKLRIGGIKRIAGCYVHGADESSMKRRAYHLLDYQTGKTTVRPRMAGVKKVDDNAGGEKSAAVAALERNLPSLVLVHYLDTSEAFSKRSNSSRKRNSEVLVENTKSCDDDSDIKASGSSTGANKRRPTISPEVVPSNATLPPTSDSSLASVQSQGPSTVLPSNTSALSNSVLQQHTQHTANNAALQVLIASSMNQISYPDVITPVGNALNLNQISNLIGNPCQNVESINNALNLINNSNDEALKQLYGNWMLQRVDEELKRQVLISMIPRNRL